MIIASYGRVSLRGVRLNWHRPFGIWQVANERQQPLIGDIQMSELRGLPFLLGLVSGSLPVFALSFARLRWLLPLWFTVPNWLTCDHDSLSRCTNIVFQGGVSICPFV